MQKSHEYSEAMRQQIVQEVLSGKLTKTEAREVYHIKGKSRILTWIRIYEKYGVCALNIASKRFSWRLCPNLLNPTTLTNPTFSKSLSF